jgi:cytochrome c oxidase subunit 3
MPMGASYGKLMMWFFIDALTFSAFLAAYGFSRFMRHGHLRMKCLLTFHLCMVSAPMYYVALMTLF